MTPNCKIHPSFFERFDDLKRVQGIVHPLERLPESTLRDALLCEGNAFLNGLSDQEGIAAVILPFVQYINTVSHSSSMDVPAWLKLELSDRREQFVRDLYDKGIII